MQFTLGTDDPKQVAILGAAFQLLASFGLYWPKASRRSFVNLFHYLNRLLFGEDYNVFTVQTWMEHWSRCLVGQKSEETVTNQQAAIKLFLDWFGANADILLEDLKRFHMKEFLRYLLSPEGKHSAESANQRMEVLTNCLFRAADDKLIDRKDNPAKSVRAHDRASQSENDDEIHLPYTRPMVRAAIDAALVPGQNPELLVAMLISLDTTSRCGDTFGFRRDFNNYARQQGRFRYYCRKRSMWHSIFLYPETQSLCQEYLAYHLVDQSPEVTFFPTFAVPSGPAAPARQYKAKSSSAGVYFGQFLAAVGIRPKDPPRDEDGEVIYIHTFHSGRTTGITAMHLSGMDDLAIRDRALHESKEINEDYCKNNLYTVARAAYLAGGVPEDFLPEQTIGEAAITLEGIRKEIAYATERLKSLRGKLDLHNGTLSHGILSWRAQLVPPELRGKRKRGRPKRATSDQVQESVPTTVADAGKRKRGRPKKSTCEQVQGSAHSVIESGGPNGDGGAIHLTPPSAEAVPNGVEVAV